MKTPTQALASHLNMDIDEIKEYRYAPSRHTKPVYTYGDDYLCCTKGRAKPAQPTVNSYADEYFWDEVPSYVNQFGYKIWRRLTDEEAEERGFY